MLQHNEKHKGFSALCSQYKRILCASAGSACQPGVGMQGRQRQGNYCSPEQNSHEQAVPHRLHLHLGRQDTSESPS